MDEREKNFTFGGFQSPNFTPVPDEFFDFLLTRLAGAEIKVLLYVIRRTFGFKKRADRISKSQLENGIQRRDGNTQDEGAGLSRRAIRLAIDSLVEKRILVKKAQYSEQRGHEATEYALNIIGFDPWVQSTQGDGKKVPESEFEGLDGQKVPKPLGTVVPTQETILQDIRDNVNVAFSSNGKNGHSTPADEALLLDLQSELRDNTPKSVRTFKTIISMLGHGPVRELLSSTNDADQRGKIVKGTKAGYFVGAAKIVAKANGLDLGFTASPKKKTTSNKRPIVEDDTPNLETVIKGLPPELQTTIKRISDKFQMSRAAGYFPSHPKEI